ncbi:hypothetical protein G3578_02245 [Brevibacillus sp. SYP-B805]|uniref:hypothetical protein n=1 Tax=Brevibacillus sp. SYP-B805 TaxID=1578199 RepID=UPI0013EE0039|nr:hypothetical protein [Brevibacillus sp. SYP-B805]NGQ93991.1 hypothetical protein [Brevibacillus sp. SYP-B805]
MALTKKRSVWIGVVLLVVLAIAATWAITSKKDSSPYVNLVSYKLSKKQQQEVEAFLQKKGYDYQVKDQNVLVHQNQRNDILVEMGAEGIPSP